jgi:uncharacterized NAD(P)/FAD-binding protein YdhS
MIAIIGAGAAGATTAIRLLERTAARRCTVPVTLIDPEPGAGRGIAYATDDPRHRLNVPAGRMSACPSDPLDFVRWLNHADGAAWTAADFVPRARFGEYIAHCLARVGGDLRRVRARAVGLKAGRNAVELTLDSGETLHSTAAVLATGVCPPGVSWAHPRLRESPRFVADPWSPGALGAVADTEDVLIVGTGLTMIDAALTLDRPGRVVHAVSRHGWLPLPHARSAAPAVPPPVAVGAGLAEVRRAVRAHVRARVVAGGDWQSALDDVRPLLPQWWAAMPADDRARFLGRGRRLWDIHRHRIPVDTAAEIDALRAAGRLVLHRGVIAETATAEDLLTVTLTDGRVLRVGAVLNCTGPQEDVRRHADPLIADVLAAGIARPGPLGLGLDTRSDGRVLSADGRADTPLWAIGALRRGNLWESTAFPEIREQASVIAGAIAADTTPAQPARRRPQDAYGLPLTTTRAAAAAYGRGLHRVLGLRDGAEEDIAEAVAIDPGFALGHAALAVLHHHRGAECLAATSLAAARNATLTRGDERERGFVAAVERLLTGHPDRAAHALLDHIDAHPRDAFALSLAVPTIAFGGVVAGSESWALVERLRPAFGDDWWYLSQLAFVRQDQERWQEAGDLARRALAEEPGSGHAAHAYAHVHYETGEHRAGLEWLDGWIGDAGAAAQHRVHFSWHAALHELSLGDCTAVRRRYYRELAAPGSVTGPARPGITGPRVLVDSASMLWRCAISGAWPRPVPIAPVLAAAPPEWLQRPPTAFAALHTALAYATAGDPDHLDRLAADPALPLRERTGPLCAGLAAVVRQDWDAALADLQPLLPVVREFGGSAAQCEIVEETVIYALMSAGRAGEAAELISARLDRRGARSRRVA